MKSQTSMVNEATFQEILLPSSGNLDDYVVHIFSKYVDLDGNSRTCGPGWEKIAQRV